MCSSDICYSLAAYVVDQPQKYMLWKLSCWPSNIHSDLVPVPNSWTSFSNTKINQDLLQNLQPRQPNKLSEQPKPLSFACGAQAVGKFGEKTRTSWTRFQSFVKPERNVYFPYSVVFFKQTFLEITILSQEKISHKYSFRI